MQLLPLASELLESGDYVLYKLPSAVQLYNLLTMSRK